tara:strand:- start:230 stop:1600 length:1371 start_codon:yes stop_codon:yes gene_type:complete
MDIITRFAPSPTGSLHLGAVRTAIFNYLFTRKNKGKFILRIEDTDQERSSLDSLNQILDSLRWLGIDFDEGPYIQSERLENYRAIAEEFVKKGLAYRCYMTSEEIQQLKESAQKENKVYKYPRTWRDRTDNPPGLDYVIRFKTPDNKDIKFYDTLRGNININSDVLDDFIILKSDGYPTYNFSTAIDDSEMNISNIIRGEDHLSNTSKQILIFNSLDKTPPTFTHVSMILGKDKSKLSKRNGSKSIEDFKKEGVLPISIINYLARLGWSHGDQEIFTLDEMIKLFNLDNLTKSPAIYDESKLSWVNSSHIKNIENKELIKILEMDFFHGIDVNQALNAAKEKAKDLLALKESLKFCKSEEVSLDNEMLESISTKEVRETINDFYVESLKLDSFEKVEDIKHLMNSFLDKKNLKMKQVALPLRIILTGSKVSPGIYEIISIIGKEIFNRRIKKYLEL